jgi:predicted ATPase/DNA-binding CsgD family transcriptional regulator
VTTQSFRARKDNFPAKVTRFIGRKRELAAVAAAIDAHRLVTLRGPGGVGKTRLALQVAAAVRDTFGQGAWLVELSVIRCRDLLAPEVAKALGLPDVAPGDPDGELARHLAESDLLLVLDTCEHLVTACADLATTLLAACPGLRILATSRERLGAPGEQVMLISPLQVFAGRDPAGPGPAIVSASDLAVMGRSEAVELFLDRARATVPGYALTAANASAVARLCRRLDGIPLAIELAAVRLRSMSADEIAARLDDRFRVLGTARTLTDRHRTLRAAVRWSLELCTPAEQRLWTRISVFPGGFTSEAAGAVGGPGAREVLARLVDKSVVARDPDTAPGETAPGESPRYRLLDTMRDFGRELLPPGDRDDARRRHRDYYQALVARAATQSAGPEQVRWMAWVRRENGNLRAALDYSFTTPGQEAAGLAMTVGLRCYWLMLGAFGEGRHWHERALAACPGSPDHAWANFGAGLLAVLRGDLVTAGPLLARAADLAGALPDPRLAASVTSALGMAAFHSGDVAAAMDRHACALAYFKEHGFTDVLALVCYSRLASARVLAFQLDDAIQLCEEGARQCAAMGDQWALGTVIWVRGGARWLSGDNEAAITDALASLKIDEALGDPHTMTMCLDLIAVSLATRGDAGKGDHVRAAELTGAGDAMWETLNAPLQMGPIYAEIRKDAAAKCRAALGDARFEAALGRGAAMSLAEAVALARGQVRAVASAEPRPLTRREREIAALVAQGLGNRDIAEQLYLSKRTVDSHLEHIFSKLGFTSRTQLTNWVLSQ